MGHTHTLRYVPHDKPYLPHKTLPYFVGVISLTIKLFRPYKIDIMFHRQNSPKFLTQVTGKKKWKTYSANFAVCSHLYFLDGRPLLSSLGHVWLAYSTSLMISPCYNIVLGNKISLWWPHPLLWNLHFLPMWINRSAGFMKHRINLVWP